MSVSLHRQQLLSSSSVSPSSRSKPAYNYEFYLRGRNLTAAFQSTAPPTKTSAIRHCCVRGAAYTRQAPTTGFISAQSGPDCLCLHPWPLFRLTHGWQTKLRGLRAACRDDSLVFKARKLIPYGRPCGSETKFKCCCLKIGELFLDKWNSDQKMATVVTMFNVMVSFYYQHTLCMFSERKLVILI